MSELFHTLGINGKLLAAQLLNFLIVLVVLTFAVYKPLLAAMRKRRERIEYGLKGADEAEKQLAGIEVSRQQKMREADEQAMALMRETEQSGKKRFGEIVHGAEEKADYLLKEAAAMSKRRETEEMERLMKEAQGIIKEALIKTVELNPKDVDEKLISQALNEVRS
ncbi:MAG: hypothetical protein AAB420_02770 [Patescibacteria group bacterium]